MTWLLANPWCAVVAAFVAAPVIALVPRRHGWLAPLLSAVGPVLLGVVATLGLGGVSADPDPAGPWTSSLASLGTLKWFEVAGATLHLGWAIDSLAAIMSLVVAVVAICVIVFSASYMRGDDGWSRYFALISLFAGSMSILVMGDGFLTLFFGWELVGACSYLLIGFWLPKPQAASAATKAFLTTRVGDVGMLVGIAILWWLFGSLSYADVVVGRESVPAAWIGLAAGLIAVGAIGKSAQFPLHAWLPDAMEGPTPVSALIHAATMVAAGVYVVARAWPLFEVSPGARMVILGAGLVSALLAALIATVQRDIKKVLAYSTISQLGFMFVALGVGAWAAAFFHLVTHAGFKALLFLGSGSVIHRTHTQDIHDMGALRHSMPITTVTWLVGAFALAGLPGLSGFFSKDQVIEAVMHTHPWAGVVLLAAASVTAYYMARTTRLVFFGTPNAAHPAHEGDVRITAPLALLAVMTVVGGWMGSSLFSAVGQHMEPLAIGVTSAAVGLAVLGGCLGWYVGGSIERDLRLYERMGVVGTFLRAGMGWDEAVRRIIVSPVVTACRALWAFVDRLLVDGAVSLIASGVQGVGAWLSRMHDGDAQKYATVFAATVAFVLALVAVMGRFG